MTIEKNYEEVATPIKRATLLSEGRTIVAEYRTVPKIGNYVNLLQSYGVGRVQRSGEGIGVNLHTRQDCFDLADALVELGNRLDQ